MSWIFSTRPPYVRPTLPLLLCALCSWPSWALLPFSFWLDSAKERHQIRGWEENAAGALISQIPPCWASGGSPSLSSCQVACSYCCALHIWQQLPPPNLSGAGVVMASSHCYPKVLPVPFASLTLAHTFANSPSEALPKSLPFEYSLFLAGDTSNTENLGQAWKT